MAARTYALIFGIVYVVVALVEILFFRGDNCSATLLCFSLVHNIIHWVMGILGLIAYAQGASVSKMYAQVFGGVFLLVAILGFIPATANNLLANVLGYPVNIFYNVVHLITGVLGVWAGFGGSMSPEKST